MNVKLLLGIVLFVIGLATAIVGIAGVGNPEPDSQSMASVDGGDSAGGPDTARSMAIPFIAAISLAVGGLLIGISVGNWKNPRTHLKPGDEIVDPEGYQKMKHV
jgi:hypothetical protein